METFDKCKLCGEDIDPNERIGRIDKYNFHFECYLTAKQRLTEFIDILTLPEDKWQEWLKDDSQ